MNDALAEFREKQRQKYLERQRKDEANKTVTAPAPATTLSPSSASTFPPTIGTAKASSAQVSPNPLRTPAAPIIPTAVTHTAIEQPTLQPSLSRDEELARRLQEEEDARHARELSAQVNNDNGAPMTSSDDVRPPDTQFTERLLDTPAIPISTAYTRSLFSPDVVRPVQAAPVPPTIPQRSDYHAFGIGPSTRTIQMPPLSHVNPLAPNYAPGDAPTLRNDQSPPRHFQFSQVPTTVHPPLITPHRPTFVSHRQNPVFAAAARSPGSSWVSTPSPIPSDPEEDARERQLREDAALARRLQEEDQRAFG